MKYRKKPVVIEAIQATGTPENNREIIDWTRGSATPASMDERPERGKTLSIATLEGAHWVSPGDWIIKGVKGEFYPCKPDIFAATYEPTGTEREPTETQDVPVLEQLRRMAKDAARYRWLRGSSCRDHSLRWTQWEIRHWRAPFWSSDLRYGDLDAAIDAQIEQERSEQAKEG